MQEKKSRGRSHGMSDAQVEEAAGLFGMLAEPARLYLLRELMAGPAHVGRLVQATGMRQGTVSKHLGILHGKRFVRRWREGARVVYEVADPALFKLCDLMCGRIRREARVRARALSA